MEKYSTLKGVSDIYPPLIHLWHHVEDTAQKVLRVYGFQELRIPIIESTGVFTHSIGQCTDVVEKEMYTFMDRAGRSITLRPEGTASVVRSYVENRLHLLPSPQKYYYMGPMFRYERPQKGRFRQFYQIGAEVFGSDDPRIDAELLSMLHYFFTTLGLTTVRLEINSIGCRCCRPAYTAMLADFFTAQRESLCNDCQTRLTRNPLRLLDCKVPACTDNRQGAPLITSHLCSTCQDHHAELKALLALLAIPYVENPLIVRGLDYYTKTTFEITTEHLGAQKAVAAGGRYDDLIESLGGPKTPSIGFALGMERLAGLLQISLSQEDTLHGVYFAVLGRKARDRAFVLCESLRQRGVPVEMGEHQTSLKSQLKKADKKKAAWAVIMGEDEVDNNKALARNLATSKQEDIALDFLVSFLKDTCSTVKTPVAFDKPAKEEPSA